MWTKKFWADTGERVVSSAAGGALTAMTIVSPLIQQWNWAVIGGTAGGAAAISLAKCLLASRKGDPTSASLVE